MPTPAAAIVAALTCVLYVGVYTPLKRVTTWNTVVGAVPGALPPVIGWCAGGGTVVAEGWVLFAILFVWQLPHFYSIAWLHRDDYARGGMRMLPVVDHRDGRLTGWATALTAGVLLVVTAAPFVVGAAGWRVPRRGVAARGVVPGAVRAVRAGAESADGPDGAARVAGVPARVMGLLGRRTACCRGTVSVVSQGEAIMATDNIATAEPAVPLGTAATPADRGGELRGRAHPADAVEEDNA